MKTNFNLFKIEEKVLVAIAEEREHTDGYTFTISRRVLRKTGLGIAAVKGIVCGLAKRGFVLVCEGKGYFEGQLEIRGERYIANL